MSFCCTCVSELGRRTISGVDSEIPDFAELANTCCFNPTSSLLSNISFRLTSYESNYSISLRSSSKMGQIMSFT